MQRPVLSSGHEPDAVVTKSARVSVVAPPNAGRADRSLYGPP